jgi:hypothetical protein
MMMAKFVFKVSQATTARLKRQLDELAKGLTQAESTKIGKQTIDAMKRMIAIGLSPITGRGRFPGYKNKDKYPGKRKPHRPVNLYLSGDFLNSLDSKNVRTSKGYQPSIGFRNEKSRKKEEGHRIGWNGQPERPVIPSAAQNETIAKTIEVSIIDQIKQILKDRVQRR